MHRVVLIFRKKNERFFSIEKVFESVYLLQVNVLNIQKIFVPFFSSGLWHIWRNIRSTSAYNKKFDLYHVTGDVHYMTLGLPPNKTILTIHDLGFMNLQKGLKRVLFRWLFIKLPIRHAALVTTISENSKREILSYCGCSSEKIVVIPNSISESVYFSPLSFNMERPSILFVGTTDNKNLVRTAEAIQSISCQLVIIGHLNRQQLTVLKENKIQFINKSGLTDSEIAYEYEKSDMVLFPSLYEGFGMPVIEGQKAGRPVIASDISPIREISGGAAHLVDPYDVSSIRNGVLTVIGDDKYRLQLIEKGEINAKKFSPETISKMYRDVYSLVASRNC